MGYEVPMRQIRAVFDDETITVYQAYSPAIAEASVAAGRFVEPFSFGRMTWIKPSFLWMMYRCGWATKPGQTHVLAVRMLRTGFEEALLKAALASFDPQVYPSELAWRERLANSPVRVQWDPERSVAGQSLAWRSIQIGLGSGVSRRYANEWVVGITDMTATVHWLHSEALTDPTMLPRERPYPLPVNIAAIVGATPQTMMNADESSAYS